MPEFPFPTGLYDCFAVVQKVLSEHESYAVDPKVITFGGVSAGGNIALAVNHLCRDAGVKIKAVVVGTPTIADISQYATAADAGKVYPSLGEMEFAPLLNWARLKWFDTLKWASLSQDNNELRQEQEKDAGWFRDLMAAPNCKDLADLTVIMTAECDPLRDEGEAYGNMIKSHGNSVVIKRFAGVPHPFQHMDAALPQAEEFISDTIAHIQSVQ